jgi:hypothetical protein
LSKRSNLIMIWVYREDLRTLQRHKADAGDRKVADTVKRLLVDASDEAIRGRILDGDFDDAVKERQRLEVSLL